jgi:hypothetical protein
MEERREGRLDDLGLIADELMGEASQTAIAEIRERTLRDPVFRERRERLRAAWSLPFPEEPLALSDDRIAEADLWRRIHEQETALDVDRRDGAGGGEDLDELANEAQASVSPERWYRVLPPTWIARMIVSVLAVVGVIGWLVYRVVADLRH